MFRHRVALPPRSSLPQPEWFADIPTQFRGKRSDLIAIQQLKSKHVLAKNAVTERQDPTECINNVRVQLQHLSCAGFLTKALIKKSNILTDRTFHEIFDQTLHLNVGLVPYPLELQSDASQLYDKWFKGDVNGELLRGIKPMISTSKTSMHRVGGSSSTRSYSLEPSYPKTSSRFIGEGHLKNGDWWPLQLAAVRDGAHGEMMAGISGCKGLGAFSVVMNMASEETFVDPQKLDISYNKYPNFELTSRDQIWYCGTQGHETQVGQYGVQSAATEFLKTSQEGQQPVRVLRGSKVKSKLAPAKGLRYDGLYCIIDSVCIHQELAIWMFLLERLAGQTPIRYQGPDVRPHQKELQKWTDLQNMMAGRKSG